ncbi:MAG: DUF4351 domain-containing protein [Bryobacteraceae bacterium]|nr:DUF4351 domain-containing protein [Bryobacteraceae bacterium]
MIDIMENQIIGPAFRSGRQEGLQEGRQEGELRILRIQMEKRFGPLPAWAQTKLATLASAELERLGERIFEATTLEDLLSPTN